jgi:hypothetical protein
LTVLYATGAAGNSPAMTNLTTIDTNHVGVQIADQTPKVVVLAAPVTDNGNGSYTPNTYSKVTFSTTHAGSGKYVVAGLIPGAYSVSNNGTTVIASQVVGTDGTLSFTSNSGAFSIQQGQATSSPCDLNSDGVTNVLDVQIAVNILLGNGTCPASFVTSGGCTLTVPKIVTPALGGACIAP